MLQVSLPLMGIAGRYVLQNLELVDNSCLECAQQLSRDRRAYAEAERRVQARANRRRFPKRHSHTASIHNSNPSDRAVKLHVGMTADDHRCVESFKDW